MEIIVKQESFALQGTFSISRGSKNCADVLTVSITKDGITGYGECVPYKRYRETLKSVSADIMALTEVEFNYESLQNLPIKGAGKNAVECAYLDWWAKISGQRIWELLNTNKPQDILTFYTISLDSPEKMAEESAKHMDKPLLKLKLGGKGDLERIVAVRQARPDARIIVDANESWTVDTVQPLLNSCKVLNVEMVEQPLPAGQDTVLSTFTHPVDIVADESFMLSSDMDAVINKYDGINIKLDKSGGVYDALESVKVAQRHNLKVMIGCMMGTSLAMAPALLIASYATWVDLDGSLWMAQDRQSPLQTKGAIISTFDSALWG